MWIKGAVRNSSLSPSLVFWIKFIFEPVNKNLSIENETDKDLVPLSRCVS